MKPERKANLVLFGLITRALAAKALRSAGTVLFVRKKNKAW